MAQFQNTYDSFPGGEIVYTDKPDVIINGKKKIGIEITNFYKEDGKTPTSEHKQSGSRERIVRKAEQLYKNSSYPSRYICAFFDTKHPILKKRENVIADTLCSIVRRLKPEKTGKIPDHMTDREILRLFKAIPEIHSFLTSPYEASWNNMQGYQVNLISKSKLKEIIAEKEEKLKEYDPCDEYWLLIVIDFKDPAQDQEIGYQVPVIEYSTFDKIMLFKTMHKVITVYERPQ